jgi:hypothetical protein
MLNKLVGTFYQSSERGVPVPIHNGTVPIYWKIHFPWGLRDVSADGIWGKELKSGVVQEE